MYFDVLLCTFIICFKSENKYPIKNSQPLEVSGNTLQSMMSMVIIRQLSQQCLCALGDGLKTHLEASSPSQIPPHHHSRWFLLTEDRLMFPALVNNELSSHHGSFQQWLLYWTKTPPTLCLYLGKKREKLAVSSAAMDHKCLSLLGLLLRKKKNKNNRDWLAYKQQRLIYLSSGGWKSKTKELAGSVSGEDLIPGS